MAENCQRSVCSDADSRAGFTLIEVLIAGVILAVLGVSYAASMAMFLQTSANARERDEAREAARAQMETILAWTDHATLANQFHDMTFTAGPLNGLDGPGAPPGLVTVDSGDPDLLEVTVRVDWLGDKGDESLELSTLIANRASP